jgi:hypothetical protein
MSDPRFRQWSFSMRYRLACVIFATVFAPAPAADKPPAVAPNAQFEVVPADEAKQFANIVKLTVEQMKKRYASAPPISRGVHPKDHGCVTATFRVADELPANLRVGVFAKPCWEYPAYIRYSNASVVIRNDSPGGGHDSRGMAIKLMGVEGERLVPRDEPLTQDFLLVNHPVFAFSNVEDYEVLSEVLGFFARRIKMKSGQPDPADPATVRALRTAGIIKRIGAPKVDGETGAFQAPPVSPEQTDYFSGAPYLFGKGQAAKFKVVRAEPPTGAPDVSKANYLREGLAKRLAAGQKDIVLDFQVQVRTVEKIGKLETEIEDACTEWKDEFVTIAKITIPPQAFDTPERDALCKDLFFTPWHGVKDHQPLGGINRLKLAVY